jgi:uncharacterized protein (TIGR03067 family)
LEYHGTDPNDWLRGTFTLREDMNPKQFTGVITDCASPDYVGKPIYSIYKFDGGDLVITGNGPGETNFPDAFNAPGTRQFIFKRN